MPEVITETVVEQVVIQETIHEGVPGKPGEGGSGGPGVTHHGDLTGLGDDDHPQYHTDARGDVRYATKFELGQHVADTNNPHEVTAEQAGAVPEAPQDGTTYGRKDAAWEAIPTGSLEPTVRDIDLSGTFVYNAAQQAADGRLVTYDILTADTTPIFWLWWEAGMEGCDVMIKNRSGGKFDVRAATAEGGLPYATTELLAGQALLARWDSTQWVTQLLPADALETGQDGTVGQVLYFGGQTATDLRLQKAGNKLLLVQGVGNAAREMVVSRLTVGEFHDLVQTNRGQLDFPTNGTIRFRSWTGAGAVVRLPDATDVTPATAGEVRFRSFAGKLQVSEGADGGAWKNVFP